MDFPVCPACGQSVIDDEAEDCPFCGSSMKAKPGSKPAAQKSAAGASVKPATAAKPSAAQAKSGAGAKPAPGKSDGDDFPFDTEVPGAKTAIQAMPNSSKGRTYKVVCPMCETAGYVPPTAAGKEVKCANPKCMVPIFKAPVAVAEAPPPPPPKKSNLILVGGVTTFVMLAVGVGAYVVMSQPSRSPKPSGGLSDEAKKLMEEERKNASNVAPGVDKTKKNELDLSTKKEERPNADAAPKGTDELTKSVLKQMNDCSLASDRNRSKAYCRQLAAEAYAVVGDTKAAEAHLSQLIVVGSGVPYYRIKPNLELFWLAWQAGDKKTAATYLNAAVEDAKKLPKVGRDQLEVSSRLAAALAAAGRIPDGLTQLEGHQTAELEGQLAARVQMASDGRVARVTSVRTVLPWNFPQAVAATESQIARAQLPAALAWASAQPIDVARAECLSIWAESAARQQAKPGAADANPELVGAVKDLEGILAARVWARAACGRIAAGDPTGAEATLKLAEAALATMPAPPEQTMPEVKLTIKTEMPPSIPLTHAATAASEIAFAYSLLPDRTPQAEAALDLALAYCRALAPGLPAVSARINEATQMGSGGLRDLLKKQMMLKTDDLARQAVNNYHRALNDLKTSATQRLNLQTTILSRLIASGLKNKVWTIVSDRSVEPDLSRRDDFTSTPLTGELMELFRGTETEKIIAAAVPGGIQVEQPVQAYVKELLKNSDVQTAGEFVSKLDANSGFRDEIALTFATYLASTGKLDVAFGFIGRLTDSVLREEAYRLTASLAAQRSQADAAWKQVSVINQFAEKASMCRGIIAGLKLGPAEKDLPEPAFAP